MWSVAVLFSCTCCLDALLFACFLSFTKIITGPRYVFTQMKILGWGKYAECRFVLQCLGFYWQGDSAASSVFTAKKHPQKLGQFDVLWEHHPFFICSSLNFCHVLTARSMRTQHAGFGLFILLQSFRLKSLKTVTYLEYCVFTLRYIHNCYSCSLVRLHKEISHVCNP